MASDVDICNVALARIGMSTINALSEDNRAARLCQALYPGCVEELARAHAWTFTKKTAALAVHGIAPTAGWSYRYALPSDLVRALKLTIDGRERGTPGELYTLEMLPDGSAKTLLTDASPAYLRYTYPNTNPLHFDPLFRSALSYRLALDLTVLLTDNAAQARETMRGELAIALGQARATDANETNEFEESEPASIAARGT